MPISRFDDVADVSLADDEALLARVRDLVEGAYRRQLWFMLLDDENRQLPVLIPHDVPRAPTLRYPEALSSLLTGLVEEVRPGAIVVVLERPGSDILTSADRAWFALVQDAVREAGAGMRGPILAHDDGFRWVAAEDFLVA